jgi:hypothetical protein
MKIYIFEIWGKTKPKTENKRRLNLAARKHMTFKETKISL